MSKYYPMRRYLEASRNTEEKLTYSQIEDILGFSLAPSTYTQPMWWANTDKPFANEWLAAGWKVSGYQLGHWVRFVKNDQSAYPRRAFPGEPTKETESGNLPGSRQELHAKDEEIARLHRELEKEKQKAKVYGVWDDEKAASDLRRYKDGKVSRKEMMYLYHPDKYYTEDDKQKAEAFIKGI